MSLMLTDLNKDILQLIRYQPGMMVIGCLSGMDRAATMSAYRVTFVRNESPYYFGPEYDAPYEIVPLGLDYEDLSTGGVLLNQLAEICHTQTKVSVLSAGQDEWECWTLKGRSSGASLGEAVARQFLMLKGER